MRGTVGKGRSKYLRAYWFRIWKTKMGFGHGFMLGISGILQLSGKKPGKLATTAYIHVLILIVGL